MLVATKLLEGVTLEAVVCEESTADVDCKSSEEEVDKSEEVGVIEVLELAEGSEEVALVIYTTVSGPVGRGASSERC